MKSPLDVDPPVLRVVFEPPKRSPTQGNANLGSKVCANGATPDPTESLNPNGLPHGGQGRTPSVTA